MRPLLLLLALLLPGSLLRGRQGRRDHSQPARLRRRRISVLRAARQGRRRRGVRGTGRVLRTGARADRQAAGQPGTQPLGGAGGRAARAHPGQGRGRPGHRAGAPDPARPDRGLRHPGRAQAGAGPERRGHPLQPPTAWLATARSATARALRPPVSSRHPSNFTDRTRAAERSVYGLYNTIGLGVAGTSMPAFTQLNADQRWQLAFYVSQFSASDAERHAGTKRHGKTARAAPTSPSLSRLVTMTPAEAQTLGGKHAAILAYLRSQPTALQAAAPARPSTSASPRCTRA